jgi:hypothetical protein
VRVATRNSTNRERRSCSWPEKWAREKQPEALLLLPKPAIIAARGNMFKQADTAHQRPPEVDVAAFRGVARIR